MQELNRRLGVFAYSRDQMVNLLMEEKNKVDEQLKAQGGGHI